MAENRTERKALEIDSKIVAGWIVTSHTVYAFTVSSLKNLYINISRGSTAVWERPGNYAFTFLFSRLTVMSIGLGSTVDRLMRILCCVGAGSHGSALQTLLSHHILKAFHPRCLGALLIHAVLSQSKLAHASRAALWISIFNTILFSCFNAVRKMFAFAFS